MVPGRLLEAGDLAAALGRAHAHAVAALALGDVSEAATACDEAVGLLRLVPDLDPIDEVNVALTHARVVRRSGDTTTAIDIAATAAGKSRSLADSDDGRRLRVQALTEWGDALRVAGRYDEAGPRLTEALELARATLGEDDDDTGAAWNSLGIWHRYRGERAAAFAAYEQSLRITALTQGHHSPDAASILHNIASLHQTTGTPAEGEEPARRAVLIRATTVGPDAPDLAADLGILGVVLADLGRFTEAGACYTRARAIFTTAYGPDCVELAYLAGNEAALLHLRGEPAAAAYDEAERACRSALGDTHPQVAAVLVNRATLAADHGDPDESRLLATAAEDLLSAVVPTSHPHRVALATLMASLPSAEGAHGARLA